jgi:hypothetical protein
MEEEEEGKLCSVEFSNYGCSGNLRAATWSRLRLGTFPALKLTNRSEQHSTSFGNTLGLLLK